MLRQLNLHLALTSASVASENVQDQRGAVENLDLERVFQVALLGGRKLVVANHHVGTLFGQNVLQFLELPLAQIGWRGAVGPLGDCGDDFGAGGAGQVVQFIQGVLQSPQLFTALLGLHGHQNRSLRLRAGGFGLTRLGHSLQYRHPRGAGIVQFSRRWQPVSTRSSGVVRDRRI